MKLILPVLVAALVAGCSQLQATAFVPEPGKTGYVIECGRHTSQCYQQAEKSCPKGFDIMDSSTKVSTGGLVPVGNTVVASTATNVTLVVSCKS